MCGIKYVLWHNETLTPIFVVSGKDSAREPAGNASEKVEETEKGNKFIVLQQIW